MATQELNKKAVRNEALIYGENPSGKIQAAATDADGNLLVKDAGTINEAISVLNAVDLQTNITYNGDKLPSILSYVSSSLSLAVVDTITYNGDLNPTDIVRQIVTL